MTTLIHHISNKTGVEIQDEYNQIAQDQTMKIKATQIFPTKDGRYDAFVYYEKTVKL